MFGCVYATYAADAVCECACLPRCDFAWMLRAICYGDSARRAAWFANFSSTDAILLMSLVQRMRGRLETSTSTRK